MGDINILEVIDHDGPYVTVKIDIDDETYHAIFNYGFTELLRKAVPECQKDTQ